MDDEVTYLYDPLHPAVLRLIKMVIDAGQQHDSPVAMCGEMAGDTRYTRLLLGMGLSEFSMHHTALQEVKRVINNCHIFLSLLNVLYFFLLVYKFILFNCFFELLNFSFN